MKTEHASFQQNVHILTDVQNGVIFVRNMNKRTDYVASFAKGLRVLCCFGAARPKLNISDVSAITGFNRATCRRLLLTLHQEHYVEYDGKFFSPTSKCLRLGMDALASLPLPNLVQPWLDQLTEKTGQSCSVSVLDGTEIVYIARAAKQRIMSIGLMHGSRLPAHCTSMGRVLLSGLSTAEIDSVLSRSDLTPRTQFSLTDPTDIISEIGKVQANGFAFNDQEIELGLSSIAVPIFDKNEKIIASLNIGIAATHDRIELLKKHLPELLHVQSGLKRLL